MVQYWQAVSKHPQKLANTKQSLHCQMPVHGVQHVAVALYIACCYIASSSLLTLVADVLTLVSIPKLDSALPVRLSVGVQEWDRCVTYFELFQPLLEYLHHFVNKHLSLPEACTVILYTTCHNTCLDTHGPP